MAQKMDYFASFCKVAKAFGTTMPQSELLELIVSSATETMKAKAACLFLADPEQDVFLPVAAQGLSKRYQKLRPHAAERVVAETLKEGHLAILDATSDPRVEMREEKAAEGIASMIIHSGSTPDLRNASTIFSRLASFWRLAEEPVARISSRS